MIADRILQKDTLSYHHRGGNHSYFLLLINCLIIYCFTPRSRIFHLYGEVAIAGVGIKKKCVPDSNGLNPRAFDHVTRADLDYSVLLQQLDIFFFFASTSCSCNSNAETEFSAEREK
jgi:hypothetical protein